MHLIVIVMRLYSMGIKYTQNTDVNKEMRMDLDEYQEVFHENNQI